MSKRKASKSKKDESDDEQEQEEETSPYEITKKSEFTKIAKKYAEEARKNFFANCHPIASWTSSKGNSYRVCIAKYEGFSDLEDYEWKWPMCWQANGCQLVLACVWKDKKLVALNEFYLMGDETGVHFLKDMGEEDIAELLEDEEFVSEHFPGQELENSSGEEEVKSMNCPALDILEDDQ